MTLQVLRSNTTAKRPTPAAMADGQLAVNKAATSTGLFFKDAAANLVKVGPIHVGTAAPNATPASGGHAGHSLGESWLDTAGTNPVQKIWNGSAWIIPQPSAMTTVVTTGDTGTVTSTMILNGTIVDADINSAAAIAGSKVSPNFGSQNIVTTGNATVAALIPTSSVVPSNGIYYPTTNTVGIAANGSLVLGVDSNGASIAGSLITSHDSYNAHQVQASTVIGQLSANAGNAAIEIRAVSNNPIVLYADNLERARLTTDGHFGIGTSFPSAPLHVAVTPVTASSGNIYITPGTGAGQARCRLYNNGGVTEWIFGQKSATDHAFTISSQVAGVDVDYITVSYSDTTPMVVFRESLDVKLGTGFGTRLGTQSTERLGFWGATPTTRPTAVANATDATSVIARLNDLLSRLRTIGLIASS